MELTILKFAFFQIASLFYVILVMGVYYSKKKIMTIENYLYSTLLLVVFGTLLFDIGGIALQALTTNKLILNIINRIYMISSNIWLVLFTYYVFAISSKKNQGYVSLKENKEKEYFKNVGIIFGFYIMAIIVCGLTLKLTGTGTTLGGPILFISYITIGLSLISQIIFMISNFAKDRRKLYTPVLVYIICMIIGTIVKGFLPNVLLVSSLMAFTTVIMYFTVENPDVNLIKELNEAKEEADKANNAKTEFLSNMSHEIRTPLNAIVGFSEALKEENISEEAKDEVDDIIMSSNNLIEIVNGILDISKIEANSLEIVKDEYDSRKLFNEVVNLGKARLASRPIDFKVNIDKDLPPILYGDYARLKQIVINLVTNATKYTKEGNITLSVAANNKETTTNLVIKVSDTGSGIKKENLDKLFTKFQKIDLNTKEESNGLGLTISKSLISLMNGTISVESEFGKGSTFTVEVEQGIIRKNQEEIQKEIIETTSIKVENKKVLVVDDNSVNLKVAVRLLQDYGIESETVSSGQDCINKILGGAEYDLIFMDDMMPRMTGTECFQKLLEIKEFNTPIIALTANAITGMKEKYLSIGFSDYLAKPIIKQELSRIIKRFLSGEPITLREANKVFAKNNNQVTPNEQIVEEIKEEQVEKEQIPIEEATPVVEETTQISSESTEEKNEKPNEVEEKTEEEVKTEIIEEVKEEPKEELKIEVISEDEKEKVINETMELKDTIAEVKEATKEKIEDEKIEAPKEEIESTPTGEKKDADFLKSKGVDVDHGLELLFDMETYDMAIEEFVNNYEERRNKLEQFIKDSDMPNYAIEVHAMKSDSKYLGFMTLADLSYEHEMASKADNKDFVKDNFNKLTEESDKIYKIAKEYLGQ